MKNEDNDLMQIPLIVLEQNELRSEARFKKLWAIIIIQTLLFVGAVGFGAYYLLTSEITSTDVTTSVQQNNSSSNHFSNNDIN